MRRTHGYLDRQPESNSRLQAATTNWYIVGRAITGSECCLLESSCLVADSSVIRQQVTFFFKAHIMAGQVHPEKKTVKDFAWLTKQEIETRVESDYWEGIKDTLSDF
jgi:hypothetical protein